MPFEGRLQQWNEARGFGFIEIGATRERVFVHASALPRDGMRPATGARLTFDVERDGQGRKRAVNVRLADARNAVPMTGRPAPPAPRPVTRPRLARRRGLSPAWAVLAIGGVIAAVAWRALPTPQRTAPPDLPAAERPAVDAEAASRRCDGRTYCSQMRSCDEATWFLQHCPGVKLDGDRNGVPCEREWCGTR